MEELLDDLEAATGYHAQDLPVSVVLDALERITERVRQGIIPLPGYNVSFGPEPDDW